jgi:hypothetical protein
VGFFFYNSTKINKNFGLLLGSLRLAVQISLDFSDKPFRLREWQDMAKQCKASCRTTVRRTAWRFCLGSAALLFVGVACSNTNSYDSESKPSPKKSAKSSGAESLGGKGQIKSAGEAIKRSDTSATFSGELPFQSVAADAEAWIVTETKATRIKLNEPGWPKTEWTLPGNAGNRTYVSELGLLIGRTNRSAETRGVWLAKREEPGTAIRIYDPPDMGNSSRLSVTSFKIGSQAYIGMAYAAASGNKKFVRIPIDKSKPTGIDVTRKEEREFGPVNSGLGGFAGVGATGAYGSFMDQTRKAFYLGSGSGAWGVNVETMTELPLSSVPNWRIGGDPLNPASPRRRICNFTMSTSGGLSYALAGDLKGNMVASGGAYTFAHDPVNNVIFGNNYSAGSFTVAKQECVESSGSDCTIAAGTCQIFPNVPVGPMSAVGDGRVVGIQRGNPSRVYLISLKEKNNIRAGVEVTSIAEIQGDAYMYNDFTGITLYAPDQVKVIEFKSLSGFKEGKDVKQLLAGWTAQSKNTEDLRGLKLELVCYKTGKPKPVYVDYSAKLRNSASLFAIDVKDCSGQVDAIEVKMSSDGTTNNFTRLSTFEIRGVQ